MSREEKSWAGSAHHPWVAWPVLIYLPGGVRWWHLKDRTRIKIFLFCVLRGHDNGITMITGKASSSLRT